MITFQSTGVFFLAWLIVGLVTALSNLSSTDATNFSAIADQSYNGEVVSLDNAPLGGGQDISVSSTFELPKTTTGWVSNIGKAATFQAPIWDSGWANIVRVVLATIGGAYMLVLIIKGLEIVANLIPG